MKQACCEVYIWSFPACMKFKVLNHTMNEMIKWSLHSTLKKTVKKLIPSILKINLNSHSGLGSWQSFFFYCLRQQQGGSFHFDDIGRHKKTINCEVTRLKQLLISYATARDKRVVPRSCVFLLSYNSRNFRPARSMIPIIYSSTSSLWI